MSKRASSKGLSIQIISTPLEEYIPIDCTIIGNDDWLFGSFDRQALVKFDAVSATKTNLNIVRDWLDTHKNRCLDTETTGADKKSGLDPWRSTSRMLLAQIGDEKKVFVIQPDLLPEFKEQLEDKRYVHVLQNGIFDWKYLFAKYNIHINSFFDTMLAEQLLTSGKLGLLVNLAAIARRRPPHRIITKAVRKEFFEFKGTFTEEMIYYAARDIVLLPSIMHNQTVELERFGMMVVAQDEFHLIPVTGSMELGGVPFSERTLRLALVYWKKRQDDLERKILKIYDERVSSKGNRAGFLLPDMKFEFDVNSPSQKLAALRELGFSIEDVKRETLEELDDPIAQLLGQYSEALKINSTYGENMIQRMNPTTHRLQVEFNQLGHGDIEAAAGKATTIATGRYSSDFQQLPRARVLYEKVTGPELNQVQALFGNKIKQLIEEQHV